MRVGFLGLGIMGGSMAANLVKAGNDVTVWNRSAGKSVKGAKRAATPREAVANAEAVWICVSDTAAVEDVPPSPEAPAQEAGGEVVEQPEGEVKDAPDVESA
jgi:3-hydroxyisobutyrate dehydrogenase-like beta-hydroxyacid dehydrogenase